MGHNFLLQNSVYIVLLSFITTTVVHHFVKTLETSFFPLWIHTHIFYVTISISDYQVCIETVRSLIFLCVGVFLNILGGNRGDDRRK